MSSDSYRTAKVNLKGDVLVADDVEQVRSLVARFLGVLGYSALQVSNGAEAVALYRRRQGEVLLVILDVEMPVMGGLEALSALREINPAVKAIIMSGTCSGEEVRREVRSGEVAFIRKPFTFEAFNDTVLTVLAGQS